MQIAIFGMTALTVGLIAVRFYPSTLVNNFKKHPQNPNFPQQIVEKIKLSTPPTAISFPNLNLNLTIAPGVIKDNEWTLFDDKVSWLSTSETPGHGNVIVYGHNRPHLFGDLDKMKIGQEVVLAAGDKKYTYVISELKKVTPEDVNELISAKNQLTIYTCNGSFDEKRLVLKAFPKENKAVI